MARKQRIRSSSNIYHVMLRGINHQQIFYDEHDYSFFLDRLSYFKGISNYEIYAYCLMGNHIHLLIKTCGEPLEIIFRRIGSSFVYWYNAKYQRSGHLFQDRFKSEVVENEQYFVTVLRYIIQNPINAGLCASAVDYAYSSAREYMRGYSVITDIDFAMKMVGREALRIYLERKNDDKCLDIDNDAMFPLSDSDAMLLIKQELGSFYPNSQSDFKANQEKAIIQLIKKGVKVRQLNRLSGISRGMIRRVLRTIG